MLPATSEQLEASAVKGTLFHFGCVALPLKPKKWIYVLGTADPFSSLAQRRARVVGMLLARLKYGLVCGNSAGVDKAASLSYAAELRRHGGNEKDCFRQIRLPSVKRGDLWPISRYNPPTECRIEVRNSEHAMLEATATCDAAILIGGRWRALHVARRFMDAGKPVFPLPFSGGRSDEIFQEIMRGWSDNPIPGLSRNQALRLAMPWVGSAHSLPQLLQGALSKDVEIFLSYRRADTGAIAGRMHASLIEHFGNNRVFMDAKKIEHSAEWRDRIQQALKDCSIGLIFIGADWLNERLRQTNDTVRLEVRRLLDGKAVYPILVDGASLPRVEELPSDLSHLPNIEARALNNSNWEAVTADLIASIEKRLEGREGVSYGSGRST